MPWSLLAWIFCFFLQAGLVGIVFYTLIQLYDFEEDLLNNSDCARRCNRFVVRSWQRPLGLCRAYVSVCDTCERSGHDLPSQSTPVISQSLNFGLQYIEAGLQVAVLLASILSGHFLAAAINLAGAALVAERVLRGKHMLDALELWKQLPTARRFTYMKLAAFSLAFVFTTFRCAAYCHSPE